METTVCTWTEQYKSHIFFEHITDRTHDNHLLTNSNNGAHSNNKPDSAHSSRDDAQNVRKLAKFLKNVYLKFECFLSEKFTRTLDTRTHIRQQNAL